MTDEITEITIRMVGREFQLYRITVIRNGVLPADAEVIEARVWDVGDELEAFVEHCARKAIQ